MAVIVGGVIIVAILAFLALRPGDAPIQASGRMDEADREAKARSSGIDHLTPPSS